MIDEPYLEVRLCTGYPRLALDWDGTPEVRMQFSTIVGGLGSSSLGTVNDDPATLAANLTRKIAKLYIPRGQRGVIRSGSDEQIQIRTGEEIPLPLTGLLDLTLYDAIRRNSPDIPSEVSFID